MLFRSAMNLFSFITFRVALALATGLILTLLFGHPMILWLRKKQGKGQPIRTDGPESHQKKKGTPTMGGFLILFGILSGTLLWGDLKNQYIWIVLFVTVGFCAVGFIDDYQKVTKKGTAGLSGKVRLLLRCRYSSRCRPPWGPAGRSSYCRSGRSMCRRRPGHPLAQRRGRWEARCCTTRARLLFRRSQRRIG